MTVLKPVVETRSARLRNHCGEHKAKLEVCVCRLEHVVSEQGEGYQYPPPVYAMRMEPKRAAMDCGERQLERLWQEHWHQGRHDAVGIKGFRAAGVGLVSSDTAFSFVSPSSAS